MFVFDIWYLKFDVIVEVVVVEVVLVLVVLVVVFIFVVSVKVVVVVLINFWFKSQIILAYLSS